MVLPTDLGANSGRRRGGGLSDYQDIVAKMYESSSKLIAPEPLPAYVFLVSEMGEVGSSLMNLTPVDLGYGISVGYVRNNPERHENPEDNIILEIGQVLMMLSALANGLGLDLDVCFCRAIERMSEVHGGK